MISIEEAIQFIDQNVLALGKESVPLDQAVGRTLSENILSDVNSPPHDKSVMDGFAIRSEDLNGGVKSFRVVETVIAGDWPSQSIGRGEATRIMTGAPVPEGADAVIMVELANVKVQEDGVAESVEFRLDSVDPEKHLLRTGTNFQQGQLIFESGHVVRPTDIGLLAEVGASQVSVGRLPSAAVLPTGNELVDCSELPGRGQIRNSNGPMLRASLQRAGLSVMDLGVGLDDPEALESKIRQGLSCNLLLLSGGVSAGKMDLVPGILAKLGVRQVFHKVCVKPGKPVWFGVLEGETQRSVVFGLPGNPVSSLVGLQLFVRAAIEKMVTGELLAPRKLRCQLSADHQSRGNRPTYWPGREKVDDSSTRRVEPLVWRGSSDLYSLGQADGLIHFPADKHDHRQGDTVSFYPFG